MNCATFVLVTFRYCYLAPHRGRARYCNAHVCVFVCVCLFVCVFAKFQSVISQPFLNRSLWNLAYILRMGTPWLTNIFRILGYLAISRERMVVEIRDWCQNVGEYNTYNFWHFGLCVIVSKIDRCRSSDPPYEIAINPIFRSYRVSDVIIQSFLNRSRWNLVHTLVARRARSAISDCLVFIVTPCTCNT